MRTTLLLGAAASMALALTSTGGAATADRTAAVSHSATHRGGTLTYYLSSGYDYTDPQRIYVGAELTNLRRTVYRSLVAFPISKKRAVADRPVPDLATDTGRSSHHAKTWKFTLKRGIAWQDGRPVACANFKYGASRVFATDVLYGGPNYLLTYLDIPTNPRTGLPIYTGPYKSSRAGRRAFNRAITCKGRTITYHFKKPWPDFPLAIAGLDMMDPYRKDKDHGDRSRHKIFSDGPYKVTGGSWPTNRNAVFVRNRHYRASTDSRRIRKALPDKIVFNVGLSSEAIIRRLIRDKGAARAAVTQQSVPLSMYYRASQVTGRATHVRSPYVDYLALNFKKLTNSKVRRALALATNRGGWRLAGGGSSEYAPAQSIVSPDVAGYRANPSFTSVPMSGDVNAAHKLLVSAGVKLPYPVRFTYPSSPIMDAQAIVLMRTWEKAGFKPFLDGISNVAYYYTAIQEPDQKSDVVWAGWGADWPSAITVTPPLFDSRPNLSQWSNGQDYGAYNSTAFNRLVDRAEAARTLHAQTRALRKADARLGRDTAYIPMDITKFYFLRGSKVTGFKTTPASSSYPDLGGIGVR
jgi:peptide/nickel transport system substrate-binding protein